MRRTCSVSPRPLRRLALTAAGVLLATLITSSPGSSGGAPATVSGGASAEPPGSALRQQLDALQGRLGKPAALLSSPLGFDRRRVAILEQPQYNFPRGYAKIVGVGSLGGGVSVAAAINNKREVVGSSIDASGFIVGYRWKDGVMQSLGVLPGYHISYALDINEKSQIVGYCVNLLTGAERAFLWDKGALTDLGTLGGDYSRAYRINKAGLIAGTSRTDGQGNERGFVWQRGRLTALQGPFGNYSTRATALNDQGYIGGMAYDANSNTSFVMWRNGRLVWHSGGVAARPVEDMNAKRWCVGERYVSLVANPRRIQNLFPVAIDWYGYQAYPYPHAINAKGYAVGHYWGPVSHDQAGILWTPQRAFSRSGDRGDVHEMGNLGKSWGVTTALGINDKGDVVGIGQDVLDPVNTGNQGFVLLHN